MAHNFVPSVIKARIEAAKKVADARQRIRLNRQSRETDSPREIRRLSSSDLVMDDDDYKPDVFKGRDCRVELVGFVQDTLVPTYATTAAAKEFVSKFVLRHEIEAFELDFDGVCSGAGDVRIVYTDGTRTIAFRAVERNSD